MARALVALLLIAVLGLWWRNARQSSAAIQAARDSTASLAAQFAAYDQRVATAESLAALERHVRQRELAQLRRQARATGERVIVIADTVTVPDTYQPVVAALRAAFVEHLAADSAAWAADAVVHVQFAADSTVWAAERDTLRQQRDQAMRRAAANLALARPSRFWQGVGVGAAVIGGVLVAVR